MPTWRRSGFWTTSLRDLDLDALEPQARTRPAAASPRSSARRVGDEPARRAARAAAARSVVHVELDPDAGRRAAWCSCSLEDAFREHPELVAKYFMRRLTYDRDKLDAASDGLLDRRRVPVCPARASTIERPLQIAYVIDEPGHGAVRPHARRRPSRARTSACASTTSRLTSRGRRCTPATSSATSRATPAAGWRTSRTGAPARSMTCRPISSGSVATAYCTWIPIAPRRTAHPPAPRARHRQSPAPTCATAASTSPSTRSTSTSSPWTSTRSARPPATPSGSGAATGASRASYEGLIKIRSGAQESHTYLQTTR